MIYYIYIYMYNKYFIKKKFISYVIIKNIVSYNIINKLSLYFIYISIIYISWWTYLFILLIWWFDHILHDLFSSIDENKPQLKSQNPHRKIIIRCCDIYYISLFSINYNFSIFDIVISIYINYKKKPKKIFTFEHIIQRQ